MSPLVNFLLMQVSLIAVVLLLHCYIGLHIIRRGIIFSDLVLDQLAAFGMMAGIGIGVHYGTPMSYLLSAGCVLIGCILLAVLKPQNRQVPREAIIGILYGAALVASILLADKMHDGGASLNKTLVGSMLWVSWPLIAITTGAYGAITLFHFFFRKQMIGLAERPEALKHRLLWEFLFFLSQGIITILIVPVAGVLLAYGFLMIPAAIGTLFSRRWGSAILIGWGSSLVACLLGLAYSYQTDSPYGPSLLLAMGLFFLAALLFRACRPGKCPVPKGETAP